MKIRIYLTANNEGIPFNYTHQLCGIFHQWIGPNDLHNMMSLYSLGWLNKAKAKDGKLWFDEGTHWDIGIFNDSIAEQLVRGLLLKEFYFYGMQIRKVARLEPPEFDNGRHRFLANSPVVLRRIEDDQSRTFLLYSDGYESNHALTRLLRHKLDKAGKKDLSDKVYVRFDDTFRNPKTKLIDIKGIKNKGSVCPVIAEGPPEALEFLWTVGAGEMTGVGFGSLDHTATIRNGR